MVEARRRRSLSSQISAQGDDRPLATRTIAGAAWLMSWRFVTRSFGIVSTLTLARMLVPADFGIVAMATTFAAAVDALSQLGLQDALVRQVGAGQRLFDTAFTLQVLRALMTSAIVASGAPACAWWFAEPKLVPVILVLAAGSLLTGFENVGIVEFRRDMRYDRQFRLLLVPRIVQVALTIPLALLLHSYWALLIGIIASQTVRVAMSYVLHPFRPGCSLAGWRELAGFSAWTWASCLVGLLWDRAEPFVLGPAVGPSHLALYLLAAELAMLPLTEFIAPVSDALFAAFASAQKTGGDALHHAPLVAAMLITGTMPIAITISFGSDYVVAALLGPKWAEASALTAVLAWLCLFSPVSFVCNMALVANGYVRRNFVGKLAAGLIKLAVLLWTVSVTDRLDLIALAITLCVAVESCCFGLLLHGLVHDALRPTGLAILRVVIAGGLTFAVLHVTGKPSGVGVSSLLAACWCAAIGIAAIMMYVPALIGIWWLCGSPRGPESRIIELLSDHLRPGAMRFMRRVRPPV